MKNTKIRHLGSSKTEIRKRTLVKKRSQRKQKKRNLSSSSASVLNKRKTVESLIFTSRSEAKIGVDLESKHEEFALIEDSFEVVDKLTEGGQGEILKAKDRFLNRLVALKSLKSSPRGHPTSKRTFLEEAKLTAQLDHPSIIPVYSVNTDQSRGLCFSMKFVHGITLANYLNKVVQIYEQHGVKKFDVGISLRNRLEYFLKVCDAITYAHDKCVVHRDLKPDNIMIGEFHEVYVMDWGIAGIIPGRNQAQLSQSSLDLDADTLFGTTGFIDPASVENPTPHPQADIYALGIILYQIVTLRQGYLGNSQEEVLLNAMEGKHPPVKHRFPHVRILRDLSAIIEKAREANRETRYAAVNELAADVRRYLSNKEVSCRPDNLPRKALRGIQRNLLLMVSLTLLLILILAGLVIYTLSTRNHAIRLAKMRELALVEYQAMVARQAHSLDSHFLHFAHLLARMGDKINKSMSSWNLNNPNLKGTLVYSSEQYETPGALPPGTVYAPAYKKEINLEYPVYKLAPGVALNQVNAEIEAIFKLRRDFLFTLLSSSFQFQPNAIGTLKDQAIGNGLPIMWIYAGFENGYLVSYPGKGGYPESYDPRHRPWYIENRKQGGILWGTPYYDINGLGIVLPCSYGLYDENNNAYGVAAIDVTLDYLVSELMTRKAEPDYDVRENTILDYKGRIVVSTRQQGANRKEVVLDNRSLDLKLYPDSFIRKQILRRKQGQIFRIVGNQGYVYAFARLPSVNWYYLEVVELSKLLPVPVKKDE